MKRGPGAEERRTGWVLVAPALLVLSGVAVQPLLAAWGLSFRRVVLVFGEDTFVGLGNYRFLLEDRRFLAAGWHTLTFTVAAVGVELLLAVPLALLLHRSFPGRGWLRAGVLIPWVVPTVVSARLWALLFNADLGLFQRILPGPQPNWLGVPGWAMWAAVTVDVWKTTPFVALILLAGLQSIPEDLFRAARVDGASPWQTFWGLTLPLLWPAVWLAVLFRSLDAFRVFDAMYVLTEGGPGNTTETLSIYAYKTLMRSGDFGYGATLAGVTFVCMALLSALFVWRLSAAWRRV